MRFAPGRGLTWLAVVICAAALGPRPAAAGTVYTFHNISNNSGISGTLGGQFSVEVMGAGDASLVNFGNPSVAANQVVFGFRNAVGVASSITDIYFDDYETNPVLSTLTTPIFESAGVNYEPNASPGNLPGGNSITPAFATTTGFSADSESPVSANGVNASGEWVALRFNLVAGKSVADVLASLNNPVLGDVAVGLRIGLHVQAIGTGGQSDAFVNNPGTQGAIPVPPAIVLAAIGGVGLGGVGYLRRRRLVAKA